MSGLWTDYRFTSVENQKLIWLSFNSKTQTLFYDNRLVISEPRPEPICWSISKVEDMNVKGIIRLTCKQDKFNQHTDYIEKDEDGNIVGMWCDYFKDGVPIKDTTEYVPSSAYHGIITYSGLKPELKINGSYKVFTVKYYNDENNEYQVAVPNGIWQFTVRNEEDTKDLDASSLVEFEEISQDENSIKQIKVKFIGTDDWINQNLKVWYVPDSGFKTHIDVNITKL